MMKKLLFALFTFLSFQIFSQSASDIATQAQNLGISSEEDVLRELQRRGMTVQDAERMALIYGIDYNEYISQYITGNDVAASVTLPVVSELVIQGDSIQEILEDSIQEDIVETLNYFGYDIFLNNPFANKEYLVRLGESLDDNFELIQVLPNTAVFRNGQKMYRIDKEEAR